MSARQLPRQIAAHEMGAPKQEFQVPGEGDRGVQGGKPRSLEEVLPEVWKDPLTKERLFTTPLALARAAVPKVVLSPTPKVRMEQSYEPPGKGVPRPGRWRGRCRRVSRAGLHPRR
jgi:hypothetical protein